MKQTVEEAANNHATNDYGGTVPPFNHTMYESFLVGSAWQKEQGIEWIECDEKLPAPIHVYDHGTESTRVLLTDGNHIGFSFHIWFKNGDSYGWHSVDFIPTHWALITLPKKD